MLVINELQSKSEKKKSSFSKEENQFLEKVIKNDNKDIKKDILKLSIDLVKQNKININKETINYLMGNINKSINISSMSKGEDIVHDIIISDLSSKLILKILRKKIKYNWMKVKRKN